MEKEPLWLPLMVDEGKCAKRILHSVLFHFLEFIIFLLNLASYFGFKGSQQYGVNMDNGKKIQQNDKAFIIGVPSWEGSLPSSVLQIIILLFHGTLNS